MAVHAHPDDEASTTGGILARYSDEGVRTVLVTCTDGRYGDGPGGVKPGEPGHDPDTVVEMRRAELDASCRALGVSVLERLDYRDSGMMGWETNSEPGSFWSMDVEAASQPLAKLIERYRPQVVVTYDENGFYGHPDHIMAHRITVAAVAATAIPDKLYYPGVPRSRLGEFAEMLREAGIEPPFPSEREEGQYSEQDPGAGAPQDPGAGAPQDPGAGAPEQTAEPDPPFGTPDELISTQVDVSAYAPRKFAALHAHASQSENIFFLRLPEDLFARVFGTEAFVRAMDRTGAEVPEDDIFAGLRG
jgi:LmbE family N-acetylglucosaminyl deacetylase